jgi:hypothetical protein
MASSLARRRCRANVRPSLPRLANVPTIMPTRSTGIIAGIILIGVGFAFADSIFLGDFGILSLFFDGLGLLWIGKGVFQIWRQRQPQQ